MMSVQRTDSEGDGSFEEMGDPWEDFASSEKLVEQIDQDYKELLDETRAAVLAKIDALKQVMGGTGGIGLMKPAPSRWKTKSKGPCANSRI